MEFPDRPIDRENPNSLSLEADTPCTPEQRQRDRAEASIEGKHPKVPRAQRENPILPRLPASAGLVPRKPAQAYAHTTACPHPTGNPNSLSLEAAPLRT